MKLYQEYKKILTDSQKLKKAYFTTFNLSAEFFENYLLPPLVGEDIPDNPYLLEDINSSFENSKIDLKVFYDANMYMANEAKRTVVKFYPILLKEGLFHPKVIYLEYETDAVLFVGSGNITLSGWGRNTEAFKIVKMNKQSRLFQQVTNFFIDVELLAGIRKNNTKIKNLQNDDKGINFIYSFNREKKFLESLHLDKKLYVWSPYFSDIKTILSKKEFTSLDMIAIVPDLVDNKMRVANIYENEKIQYLYHKREENINMNHSKVWISDTKLAIGSYNCTVEAIDAINFEAALVEDIDISNIKGLPIRHLDDLRAMETDELEKESLDITNQFKAIFELIADWQTQTLQLKQIIPEKQYTDITLLLPSHTQLNIANMQVHLSEQEKELFFRALIKNKLFKVFNGDEFLFEGIVLEENTKNFREPLKVETLDDVLSSFIDKKDPLSAKYMKSKIINYDENPDEFMMVEKNSQNFLNYFNLFSGFVNMKSKLEKIEKDSDLQKFCFNSSNSISAMKYVINKNKVNSLFTYLFIDELNDLIQLANKKLKNEKIEFVDNVKIKLTGKDKKFIKVMK